MNRNDRPDAAARNDLAARLVALGYRGQDLAEVIREGMTRGEIAAALIAVQRNAPKRSG